MDTTLLSNIHVLFIIQWAAFSRVAICHILSVCKYMLSKDVNKPLTTVRIEGKKYSLWNGSYIGRRFLAREIFPVDLAG